MTEPRPAEVGALASTRWRVGFAATLLIALTAGGLMQFVLGVLAPFLTADLGLSRAQLGSLTTAFFAVGAIVSPFAGRLVDRVGGRATLHALFWVAVASFAGMAAAAGYWTVLVAVGVAGVATALMNPVTNQLIVVHLPRGKQGVTFLCRIVVKGKNGNRRPARRLRRRFARRDERDHEDRNHQSAFDGHDAFSITRSATRLS